MTHRMDIRQIMKEGLPFMDMRISTATRTGAAALALAGIVLIIPGVLLPEAAASAAATQKFILPAPRLQELRMTSMRSGWALGTNDALYYTQTDGQHWIKLGKFPWTRFSVGNHGHLAWGVTFPQGFPRGTTKSAIVVEAANPQGKLWQRTIYPPEKRLVLLQWSATPTAPLAGLVLSARTSPSNLAEEVWTFNAGTRQASLSYKANPIPQTESPMTAVGVESSSQAWGTSISPGPGPGLWSIRSGKASPILLSIPKGLTHGPVGPIKPAPIATPQFVDGTGFLAANYQTISLSSQTQVADALLYRTRGKRWVPVWHRPGYIDLANFITPKIGWIEWAAIAGARPALFKTVNGGRTFVHLVTPGPGKPFFINPQDGWWIDLSPAPKLWTTVNGGRTWTPVRVQG